MGTLYLLRHAKSSWGDPARVDHDRPLAPRGLRAARRMARHLREAGVAPDLVLCSSALRARQTFELVQPALGEAAVRVEEGLYGAAADRLLERLRALPEPVRSVMLVGHNPGLQDLALDLAGGGARLPELAAKLPTGALATLRTDGPWATLGEGAAELVDLVTPRGLAAG